MTLRCWTEILDAFVVWGRWIALAKRMTKILIVNPNTTASMTATIAAAARDVAATGTEIVAVTSAMGPASIEGFYDEAFAVPGLIHALIECARRRCCDHRLFRRHRPRRGADRGAVPR